MKTKWTEHTAEGDGVFVARNRIKFRIACCDCGLVHDMVMVVRECGVGKLIGVAVERNERSTAARRREMRQREIRKLIPRP